MGKMKIFFYIIILIIFLYFSAWTFLAYMQDYKWDDMDWEGDGTTTLLDFLKSIDIGRRNIDFNGIKCTEYYYYKDGTLVKTVCPE